MTEIPSWLFAFFCVSSLCVNVPAGLLLDQLLRHQYRFHPDEWEAEGRASGFLWCPRDADWLYTRPPYGWVFRTPTWIAADPKLRDKLNVIRVLHLSAMMLFIVFVFCAVT